MLLLRVKGAERSTRRLAWAFIQHAQHCSITSNGTAARLPQPLHSGGVLPPAHRRVRQKKAAAALRIGGFKRSVQRVL